MIKKKEVVLNSVAEFLGIWAVKGQATLSLTTQDGVTTVTFSHSLSGHPEDPLHPPPAAPRRRRRRRHRGPARRDRDRLRAVRHQAAFAASPTPVKVSAASSSTPEVLRSREQSNLATLTVSPNRERREENEDPSTLDRADPPEPPPTCPSPPTPATSALAEVWDFLKQAEEQRQADREADQVHREECFATLAQVVIKEKLGKASDVLST